jgi:hypothetical protein
MSFSLRVAFDERPLKTPGMRRFSLIFTGDGDQEIAIRGFLFSDNPKEIKAPTTALASGKPYSVAILSPALQLVLLEAMEDHKLFIKQPATASQAQDAGFRAKEFTHGTR